MPKDYLTWSLRGQLILVAIAALLIWLLTVFFIRPISDALAADNRLHATLLVMELVDEYVRTNSAWPGSWKDLEGIGPNESAGFRWPEDRGEVTTMVYVDFQIDSEDIAEDVDLTPLIRPIGDAFDTSSDYYAMVDQWKSDGILSRLADKNRETENNSP